MDRPTSLEPARSEEAMRNKLQDAIEDYKKECLPASSARLLPSRKIWLSLPAIAKFQVPPPFWIFVVLGDPDCSDECLWGLVDASKGGDKGAAVSAEVKSKGEVIGQNYTFATAEQGGCSNCDTGPRTVTTMINITQAVENMEKAGRNGPPKRIFIVAQDCHGARTCRAEVGEITLHVEGDNGAWSAFDTSSLPLCLKKAATREITTE